MKDRRAKEFVMELAELCRRYNAEITSDCTGDIVLTFDRKSSKIGKRNLYELGIFINADVKIEKERLY